MRLARIGVSVTWVCSIAIGSAQVSPPLHTPWVEVHVGSKVSRIDYSSNRIAPVASVLGTYYSDVQCTASFHNLPPNWTIQEYRWTPTDDIDPGSPVPTSFLFPAPGLGSTITGTGYITGILGATCTVKCLDDLGLYHYYSASDSGAVIGGDLRLAVYDRELPTFDQDEGDTTKAFYLQYLGHDPVNLPALAQRPQKGRVQPKLGQPALTSVTITVPGVRVMTSLDSLEEFAAIAASGTGAIVPTAVFTCNYDGGSLSASDCCSSMPFPNSYKFTSHAPTDLQATLFMQGSANSVDQYGTIISYAWERQDSLKLFDNLSTPMPGVFVQERFDPAYPLPSGQFWHSTPIYLWQTLMDGSANAIDDFEMPNPLP